jgi:hypothetical protein
MESNNITNLIGSKRFKLAQNANTNIELGLEGKTKPLTEYDIIDIVNSYDLFLQERDTIKKYRFNGRFNIFVNGEVAPNSSFYSPTKGKFDDVAWSPMFFGPQKDIPQNWVMQIVYPAISDPDFNINKKLYTGGITSMPTVTGNINSKAFRGLQYETLFVIPSSNNPSSYNLSIKGVQKHKLQVGDYIYLYNNVNYNIYQGIHEVSSLGINSQNNETDLTLSTVVNTTFNSGLFPAGNFVRIVGPSFNDITFNSAISFNTATATDISGGTTGAFGPNEPIFTTVTTLQPHNLLVNNFVDIRRNDVSTLNGVFRVYYIVSPTKFVIRTNPSANALTKGNVVNFANPLPKWRKLDGTPSEYYVRKFEVLTTNSYSVNPCAFSSSIYQDVSLINTGLANDTWLFQFNQDVDLKNLKSNRNGEISEVYYTTIKRAGKQPIFSGDSWSNVNADWEFNNKTLTTANGIEFVSIYNPSGLGSIEKLSARTETIDVNGNLRTTPGSLYVGDFCEFNSLELTEKVVSEIVNRFTINSNPNGEGYYYKPFKKLELRKYSDTIETAESIDSTINVPTNYVTYADNTIAWRDLLPIGYFENLNNGVDYPFLNGAHYFYFNNNFYVRRQIPDQNVLITLNRNNLNTEVKC